MRQDYLIRVGVGSLTMFFQQWTGINAVLYVGFIQVVLSDATNICTLVRTQHLQVPGSEWKHDLVACHRCRRHHVSVSTLHQ